jgi:hypothetical protein
VSHNGAETAQRRVDWSTTQGWNTFLTDCGGTPDVALTWIEENLFGPWSYRTLSAKEYEAEYGRPYDGRFVLVIAIKNKTDADKLYAHFGDPAGSA